MGTIYNNIPSQAPTDNVYLNSLIYGGSWTPSVGTGAKLTWSTSAGKIYQDVNVYGSAWLLYETNALKAALQTWSNVANVQFNQVSSIYYSDLRYFNVKSDEMLKLVGDNTTLGSHEVPDGSTQAPLYGIFNKQGTGWSLSGLKQGGFGFLTLIHEIGHGLGLDHPHDGNTKFPGVTSEFGSLGENNLNQGIWTVMSYNDGWVEVPTPTPALSYGQAGTPMAFDIATIQYIYGANTTYKTGNDTYLLPTSNVSSTYWSCIWDAGGVDTISAATSRVSAEINLNAAPLIGPNAAGFVSHVGKAIDGTAIVGGFTIANNVVIENATGGSADDILIGNQANNLLLGNAGNDTLYGNAGNDILNGGLGADTLIGGIGDDTYFVDNVGDTVDESSGSGFDLVKVAITVKNDTYALTSGVENATLTNKIAYNLTGNSENNFLTGNAAANILTGGDGMDILFGGAGADTLIGGLGIDTYVVDNIADIVIEQPDEGDLDIINSFISFDLSIKGANVEYLQLVGKATIGKGNDLNNGIFGNSFANILSGAAGDDEISGGLGNDSLDGGTGADTMNGGDGNDTYYVDDKSDTITENNAAVVGGVDLVKSSISFDLSFGDDNIVSALENLTLIGSDHINATGNSMSNTLTGNSANNKLNGKHGADKLIGGAGEDWYDVDLKLIGVSGTPSAKASLEDSILEVNSILGGFFDSLNLHGSLNLTQASTINLASGLEVLSALDTGTTLLNLKGNSANNFIIGNDANNVIYGGAGNDELRGFLGDNILYGETGKDTLIGDDGNDTLDGGLDVDNLYGGRGDDAYFVDIKAGGNAPTVTIELQDNIQELNGTDWGIDTLKLRGNVTIPTTASTELALTGTLANIENLDISATGTTRLNLIGNAETNILIGNAANNTLTGGNGNDTLNGGAGADTLIGGYGDDTYIIDHIRDVISGEAPMLTTPFTLQDSYGGTNPSISANGQYVIFESYGEFNFGSPPIANDVFIKNLQTGVLNKVSDYSEAFIEDISADGRYVMYTTSANMPGDNNNQQDTYLKDLQTGITTIVSTNSEQSVGNFASIFGTAFLSDNAEFAAFSSYATDLVAIDTNGKFDAFVKNLSTGDITLASSSSSGIQANNDSVVTSISANARYVSFHSFATNLSISDSNNSIDVYLKDTQTGTTTLVSINANGEVGNNRSWYGSVSNDGNLVVFESDATNLVSSDTNSITDIFVKNIQTGDITCISTSENGIEANNKSENAKFSADGRYVIFESRANNLVAEDTNSTSDIFVKDLLTGAIQRVSTTASGEQANSDSNNSKMSDDGRYIVFQSIASNLIADDTNDSVDIFVKDLITGEVKRASEQVLTNSLDNTDIVKASISYSLGANLENLELTGTTAINGTGNELDNVIAGNATANILVGKEGDDTLIGGAGNDTLTGGIGADTFLWELADKGTNDRPAIDKITDFVLADDRLDLRDLLVGESSENILNYLDVTTRTAAGVTSTEIRISNLGGFTDGIFAGRAENQRITLIGLNLLSGTDETNLLQSLIEQNKLIIDV